MAAGNAGGFTAAMALARGGSPPPAEPKRRPPPSAITVKPAIKTAPIAIRPRDAPA
jgi:hypothetical protein